MRSQSELAKQINKETLNRIEEVDKMNRAGELPLINANTMILRALSDLFFQNIARQTRKKKDDLHLSGCLYYQNEVESVILENSVFSKLS